jgi:hypothetical protein
VTSHLARDHVCRSPPRQGAPVIPQIAVGENSGSETKDQDRTEQRWYGRVGEAQTTRPLPNDLDWIIERVERVFTKSTVLADLLDVQETLAGLKVDPPKAGRLDNRLPISKSRRALIVVWVRRARPFL